MTTFITKLEKPAINDKIFPEIANGFNDGAPVIREATVKALIHIAPMLNERTLNNDVLRHLAKVQGDEEPAIRANAIVCLGKIASMLNEAVCIFVIDSN